MLLRLALAASLLLAPARAFAEDSEPAPAAFPYEGQSKFVTIPAQAFSQPAVQAGFMVGAIVCLPGSLYKEAKKADEIPMDQQPSIKCGRALGTALGWPVYAAVGLPFLILEGIFWKAPRAIVHAVRK
ncbi:MAG: hypothetical protein HY925_16095 [Elusimicrobia bacterium]|nr:hypothetical protein [Elusimicrobiota bacterium]